MSTNLQIRNVPDELHRALKVRAEQEGKSMSELLIEQLRTVLVLPSEREVRERLAGSEPFDMDESSAALIRRERDAA
mgnify:CR=1 FL=1|jgi:plasmid stability protein